MGTFEISSTEYQPKLTWFAHLALHLATILLKTWVAGLTGGTITMRITAM